MADGTSPPKWCGLAPRRWQAEALPLALNAIRAKERGVVSAIMGAGKSRLQAEIAASGRGRVLVTVPTIALVEQMAATMDERCPGEVGRYYTGAKQADKRITVCCMPSVPTLLADTRWPGPPALWICDEAHRSESRTILDAYGPMSPGAAIAFTATPYRAEDTEELSLWSREVYTYGVADAMRDGVVVPFRQIPWVGTDGVPITEAAIALVRGVLGAGPGLVNATDIADAEACATAFCAAGIRAAAVHSRIGHDDVQARIAGLRAGDLDCLVHVNMLSEGVDLPWLRWLCMRRPTKSRVRFCQEVGRVLRSCPGKTEALLLDPMDLLGRFSLSYEAILQGMAAEKGAQPFEAEREAAERASPTGTANAVPASQMDAWRRYLRALYFAALGAGMVEFRTKGSGWRRNMPTPKQLDNVRHALAGLLRDSRVPVEHRRLLTLIGQNASAMLRGDVSDLMSVGFALRDARRAGRDGWALLCAATIEEDK